MSGIRGSPDGMGRNPGSVRRSEVKCPGEDRTKSSKDDNRKKHISGTQVDSDGVGLELGSSRESEEDE